PVGGMSRPNDAAGRSDGLPAAELLPRTPKGAGDWCDAPEEEVRRNMASTGYPSDRVRYVRGPVEETIPAVAPGTIALLRLDTDWYASTRHELTHLFPRLSPGGVLIIDDYRHWQGARQATDEFLAAYPHLFLHRVDYTCRLLINR